MQYIGCFNNGSTYGSGTIFIYLGVTSSAKDLFRKEQVYTPRQTTKCIFSLLNKVGRLNINLDLHVELFDKKTVLPVALHGIEAWGTYGIEIKARAQLKYYKYLLKLNN